MNFNNVSSRCKNQIEGLKNIFYMSLLNNYFRNKRSMTNLNSNKGFIIDFTYSQGFVQFSNHQNTVSRSQH